MARSSLHRLIVLAVVLGLITASTGAAWANEEAETPVIHISSEGVDVPDGLVAGQAAVIFQNDTETEFGPLIARLNDGATLQDFISAMQESPLAALGVVTLIGAPQTDPGESLSVIYEWQAGDHILLSFRENAPPVVLPFTVAEVSTDGPEAAVPDANIVVELVDFAFAMPVELQAGVQVWHIRNAGEQWHEMAIFRVEDGATIDDVTAAFAEMMTAGPDTESPYEMAYFWSPMSVGAQAWAEVDLEAGTYAITCFIPDLLAEEGTAPMSHLEHGMLTLVTVGD